MTSFLSLSRRRAVGGFTLVEVVIALALLVMVMAGLFSSLRGFAQAGERLEARAASADEMRLISALLRRTLASSVPWTHGFSPDGTVTGWFSGDAQWLSWVGSMPPRAGVGGMSHLRLSTVAGEGLVFEFLAFDPARDSLPDWAEAGRRVLLRGDVTLQIRYLGAGEMSWLAAWLGERTLPAHVAVGIAVAGVRWPLLLVPLAAAAPRALAAPEPPAGLPAMPAW